MAVPTSERGESKFQVLLDARKLATHTLRITANKKVFTENFDDSLIKDINETAKNIFINASVANSIRVSDNISCMQRLELQQNAILESVRLILLIQLARSLFHLPARRVRYWGGIAIHARDTIKMWYIGDKKRYKEFL
jgi:hypothetical protein